MANMALASVWTFCACMGIANIINAGSKSTSIDALVFSIGGGLAMHYLCVVVRDAAKSEP